MKKFLYILFICISLLFLTACWSYREIDKLSFLAGVAVDRDKTSDEYELTAEIINVAIPGEEGKFDSLLLSSKSHSIHDASRKMISLSSSQLYWGQTKAVIISEDIARDGMLHVIDWLIRNHESRLNLYMFVAQTEKAQDILNLEAMTTEIRSFEISKIVESSKKSSMVPRLELYELVNLMSKTGIEPVLPTIKEVKSQSGKTMEVSGGAIIKDRKFIGYINEDEVKYYLLTINRFHSGLIVLDLKNQGKEATIEILKNKSRIKPILENNVLKIQVNIKAKGNLTAIECDFDVLSKKKLLEMKNLFEEQLKGDIVKLVDKTQNEFNADIFGFGEVVKGDMPSLWKEIEGNWNSIYKDLDVDINIDISIKNTGHFSRTFNKLNN